MVRLGYREAGMDRREPMSFGLVAYWVGYAMCFGMFLAEASHMETFLDLLLHLVLSFFLSFTSWVGVGTVLMNVLIGDASVL